MMLYDNASPQAYTDIKNSYPAWYTDIAEMDALWRALGAQMDKIRAANTRALDNNFIMTADADTIAGLEQFLGIEYRGPRTLEERRSMVASYMIGAGRLGRREIAQIVHAFVTGEVTVGFCDSTIHVSIRQGWRGDFVAEDCAAALQKRIPAHLALQLWRMLPVVRIPHVAQTQLGTGMVFPVVNIVECPRLNGLRRLDGAWQLRPRWVRPPVVHHVRVEMCICNKMGVDVGVG